MPLGIVSEKEFEQENGRKDVLEEKNTSTPRALVKDSNLGRGNKQETPEVIRNIIGEEKIKGEVGKELAKLFGVSETSVSAYSNGLTSSAGTESGDLKEHVRKVRVQVKSKAAAKLDLALENITQDKLEKARVGELSAVARNMAAIVKDMDEQEGDGGNKTQIIFVAPHIRKEEQYDVIDVSARDN